MLDAINQVITLFGENVYHSTKTSSGMKIFRLKSIYDLELNISNPPNLHLWMDKCGQTPCIAFLKNTVSLRKSEDKGI